MKFRDLANMSAEQRQEKLDEIKLELMKEHAQVASGTAPKNPGRIREHRRTIARIKMLEDSQ